MSPLLSQGLGSIIRWLLGLAVPILVSNGIWTPDDSTAYVTGATVAILSLGWSLWQKYASRSDFVNALLSPQYTSEADVKAMSAPRHIAREVR